MNIVMGDTNVGQGRVDQAMGPCGLGERNNRVDRFVE